MWSPWRERWHRWVFNLKILLLLSQETLKLQESHVLLVLTITVELFTMYIMVKEFCPTSLTFPPAKNNVLAMHTAVILSFIGFEEGGRASIKGDIKLALTIWMLIKLFTKGVVVISWSYNSLNNLSMIL